MNPDLAAFLENYRDAASQPAWVKETLDRILRESTTAQREFILDPHRNIAVKAPRRVGKTSGFLRRFCYYGLKIKEGNFLYSALSRPHAEELLWEPLKQFAEENKIKGRFYESDLKFEIGATGSIIHLVGADDKKEIDKKRGRALHGAGIDEAASFPARMLRYLLDQVLRGTLMDYRGWLVLGGTPGATLDGEFYEATRVGALRSRPWRERDNDQWGAIKCTCPSTSCTKFKWSLHNWTIEDAALPGIKEEAAMIKEQNGWSDDNPIYVREYKGEWAADETGLVYRYRKYVDGKPWNTWRPCYCAGGLCGYESHVQCGSKPGLAAGVYSFFGLPRNHKWRFVLGGDLGNRKVTQEERNRNPDKQIPNRTAMEVLAYSDTCRDLYHVYEITFGDIGSTQGRITELAGRIHWLRSVIGGEFDGIFIDLAGAGGMVLDELAMVHRIAAEAPEKKNKPDAIESMNADLIDGHMKILPGSQLEQEMLSLQWDEQDPTRENKSQANDHTDCAIYAKRGALHHFAQEPARTLSPQESEEKKMAMPVKQARRLAEAESRRMLEWESDDSSEFNDDIGGEELEP